MSEGKTPVMLVLIIRTRAFDWFVASIDPGGQATPLLRSEPGNLREYVAMEPDDQLSFLRHRLSGALQQAYDRLWARDSKASQVVMLTDDDLVDGAEGLTERLAEHFHVWLTRPPVTCFRAQQQWAADEVPQLDRLVGDLQEDQTRCLNAVLPQLVQAMNRFELWEPAAQRRR